MDRFEGYFEAEQKCFIYGLTVRREKGKDDFQPFVYQMGPGVIH